MTSPASIRVVLPWPPKDVSPNARGHWTEQDDDFLRENHGKTTLQQIADMMGRSRASLRARVTKLGLAKRVLWTEDETAKLIAAYEKAGADGVVRLNELARSLGRDKSNVCTKARDLGLPTNQKRRVVDQRKGRKKYATVDELATAQSEAAKERIRKNGHPRGMLGKAHNDETKARLSAASKAHWGALSDDEKAAFSERALRAKFDKYGRLSSPSTRGSWKAGWREIGGKRNFYRSRWEANYARYLEWLKSKGEIVEWEHEPETFWFDAIKRGTRSYLPDFRVTEIGGHTALHEVKGWMDSRSRTTLRRMKKYHPHHPVLLIEGKSYRAIEAMVSRLIEGWES